MTKPCKLDTQIRNEIYFREVKFYFLSSEIYGSYIWETLSTMLATCQVLNKIKLGKKKTWKEQREKQETVGIMKPKEKDTFKMKRVVSDIKCQRAVIWEFENIH